MNIQMVKISLSDALNGESLREDFLVSCSASVAIHITPQSDHSNALVPKSEQLFMARGEDKHSRLRFL